MKVYARIVHGLELLHEIVYLYGLDVGRYDYRYPLVEHELPSGQDWPRRRIAPDVIVDYAEDLGAQVFDVREFEGADIREGLREERFAQRLGDPNGKVVRELRQHRVGLQEVLVHVVEDGFRARALQYFHELDYIGRPPAGEGRQRETFVEPEDIFFFHLDDVFKVTGQPL